MNGVWAEPGAPADSGAAVRATLDALAAWLGAENVEVGRKVPRAWSATLRG